MHSRFLFVLLIVCAAFFQHTATASLKVSQDKNHQKAFQAWREQFRVKAIKEGITPETFAIVFQGVDAPLERIFHLDKNQPEFKTTFNDYYKKRVVSNKKKGQALQKQHHALLERIATKYHVPASFILALWGIETSYGSYTGHFPVVPALASLAYEGRRRTLFEKELLSVLKIHQKGYMPVSAVKGSWTGAMGQCQFMPSSYMAYAVDEDGDGKRDIWDSIPDIVGSIANYLHKVGWKEDEPWGVEVELPQDFNQKDMGLKHQKNVDEWLKNGIMPQRQLSKKESSLKASLIQVPGKNFDEKRTFMVYDNFKNILKWNRSYVFALAVGQLSDYLKGEQ